MISTDRITYIDSLDQLKQFCQEVTAVDWIAVDTEFIRDRTYFPKFCLLQLATPHRVACIDPLAFDSLAPLDAIFDDDRIVKVFHAARQDLEILYRLRGRLPEPVFDTQLAAPFVGLPDQIGYGALAWEILGVSLEKTHSRTDWSIRPLSVAQLRYAADDVIYLGLIFQKMRDRLNELARLDWVAEELKALTEPRLYDPPPEEAWLRIGGNTQLTHTQATLLQALAAWRERLAREQDCPRNWLIKDEILLDLARQGPKTLEVLRRVRGLDDRITRRFGDALLAIIGGAADLAPTGLQTTSAPPRESPEREALLDVFTALVRVRAAEHRITPSVLATRKDLREFIGTPVASRLLRGWRKSILGDDLFSMMMGNKSLMVIDGALQFADHA